MNLRYSFRSAYCFVEHWVIYSAKAKYLQECELHVVIVVSTLQSAPEPYRIDRLYIS